MKKKIILFAFVIAIPALFTGCDAILEGFFPEFKGSPNSINISIKASDDPTVVALIPLNGFGQPMPDEIVKASMGGSNFDVSFDGLPNGKYNVYVWYDADIDGLTDDGSARKYAEILGSGGQIDFEFDENIDHFEGVCDLTLGSYVDTNPAAIQNLTFY
jgi:hypothetical protein